MTTFEQDLQNLINSHSMENGSNTPDFILARYLKMCLENFNQTIQDREQWYGRGKFKAEVSPTEPSVP
jgi:hypothetical protein